MWQPQVVAHCHVADRYEHEYGRYGGTSTAWWIFRLATRNIVCRILGSAGLIGYPGGVLNT